MLMLFISTQSFEGFNNERTTTLIKVKKKIKKKHSGVNVMILLMNGIIWDDLTVLTV